MEANNIIETTIKGVTCWKAAGNDHFVACSSNDKKTGRQFDIIDLRDGGSLVCQFTTTKHRVFGESAYVQACNWLVRTAAK